MHDTTRAINSHKGRPSWGDGRDYSDDVHERDVDVGAERVFEDFGPEPATSNGARQAAVGGEDAVDISDESAGELERAHFAWVAAQPPPKTEQELQQERQERRRERMNEQLARANGDVYACIGDAQRCDECEPDEDQQRYATAVANKPEIIVSPGSEHEVMRLATQALVAPGEAKRSERRLYNTYRYGGLVAMVLPACKKANRPASIALWDPAPFRAELAHVARFMKEEQTKEGPELCPIGPPGWLAGAIVKSADNQGIPVLRGVVETPVIERSGRIIAAAGYDTESGYYCYPRGGDNSQVAKWFDKELIDTSDAACKVALERLNDFTCDFELRNEADRTAANMLLLTIIGRSAFDGPSPLFLFDAPTAGSGKSELVKALSIAATNHEPDKWQWSGEIAEARKVITALAISGSRVVLIDDIDRGKRLGGAPLRSVLTSDKWEDRVLQKSLIYKGPWLATVAAAGNNIVLGADMDRRVVRCRYSPTVARPERRDVAFKHGQILDAARRMGSQLRYAAITLLLRQVSDGCPCPDRHQQLGSYHAWDRVVRCSLVRWGAADPLAARVEDNDTVGQSESSVFEQLVDAVEEYLAGESALGSTSPGGPGWDGAVRPSRVELAIERGRAAGANYVEHVVKLREALGAAYAAHSSRGEPPREYNATIIGQILSGACGRLTSDGRRLISKRDRNGVQYIVERSPNV